VALRLVKQKTPHPCAGMTPAQRRDFELVAVNQYPRGGHRVIKALEDAGLIEEMEPNVIGRDQFGAITRRQWRVPLHHHMQWCQWASEQR
jgi:hypothetical protein